MFGLGKKKEAPKIVSFAEVPETKVPETKVQETPLLQPVVTEITQEDLAPEPMSFGIELHLITTAIGMQNILDSVRDVSQNDVMTKKLLVERIK